MGPNGLWLTEALAQKLHLTPGKRILDLGCGMALHDFGTDDLYLSYCSQFVRPGAELGIVCLSVREELTGALPAHLKPYWLPEFWSFHRPAWWRTHWERSGLVDIATADLAPDGDSGSIARGVQ